jgi:sulfate adenylyltransferase large subunit
MPAHRPGILRLITCGSVDDGKSTLIGRLLHETASVHADQIDAIRRASTARRSEHLDLSLITDGLRAEREQGITIDVAYRSFATDRRRFVLADTPGHVQYTRNMATGASTADAAILLIDARQGVVEQTRRHACIASLLGIRHLVVCVNKMDLVDHDPRHLERVRAELLDFASTASPDGERTISACASIAFIPISALHGDNIVRRSGRMDWYLGPTLLELLEQLPDARSLLEDFPRFPVQLVIRTHGDRAEDYRGYAGRLESGTLRIGDRIVALPSGAESRIARLHVGETEVGEIHAGRSGAMVLEDDVDISRGELVVTGASLELAPPRLGSRLTANVIWMHRQALAPKRQLLVKHCTRMLAARVTAIRHRIDLANGVADTAADALQLNEIGRVDFRLTDEIAFDEYARNRATGSLIFIDPQTNATVGAGLLAFPSRTDAPSGDSWPLGSGAP